ncbi:MAG: IS630 family transposase [Burkholderiales bacterium]
MQRTAQWWPAQAASRRWAMGDNPPGRALMLCVDEKPSVQARTDTAPAFPMRPGQLERHAHDYLRHRKTDLFAALDVKTGTVIAEVHRRHRIMEFRHFLQTVERVTRAEFDLHLVLDNASTHKASLIQRWLLRHPRVRLHLTPTTGAWLNLVKRWFSVHTARRLRRGASDPHGHWRAPSMSTSAPTTQNPSPLSGPRLPIKSSNRSQNFVCELLTRTTIGTCMSLDL